MLKEIESTKLINHDGITNMTEKSRKLENREIEERIIRSILKPREMKLFNNSEEKAMSSPGTPQRGRDPPSLKAQTH